MKKTYVPPVDICICNPKRRNYLDAKTVAKPFSKAIAEPKYDRLRTLAQDVFSAVSHGKVVCPQLIDRSDGIILRWDEDGRYLFVRITFDGTISFVIDIERRLPGNKKWTAVAKDSNIEIVLNRAARYVSGEPRGVRTKKSEGDTSPNAGRD